MLLRKFLVLTVCFLFIFITSFSLAYNYIVRQVNEQAEDLKPEQAVRTVPGTAVPQAPAPQTPTPQTPAPQTPTPQTPIPQTPTPQTPPPSKTSGIRHTVEKGDTLFKLSRLYGVGLKDIYESNNLNEDSVLDIGQTVIIPVRPGRKQERSAYESSAN